MDRKEETMKKQGASKAEIQEMRQNRNALGIKISNKQQKKARVKLMKEEDAVMEDELDAQIEENTLEDFEPKKKKKVNKLSEARLKSYGLE